MLLPVDRAPARDLITVVDGKRERYRPAGTGRNQVVKVQHPRVLTPHEPMVDRPRQNGPANHMPTIVYAERAAFSRMRQASQILNSRVHAPKYRVKAKDSAIRIADDLPQIVDSVGDTETAAG